MVYVFTFQLWDTCMKHERTYLCCMFTGKRLLFAPAKGEAILAFAFQQSSIFIQSSHIYVARQPSIQAEKKKGSATD